MSLPKGWQQATIADIADTKLGKMLDAVKNKGKPVRYLGNVNVRWGGFDLSGLHEMRVTQDELDQLSVRDGDIFVCEGGEPGRTAVWRGGAQDLIFQKALHRLRVLDDVQTDYLAHYLRFAVNRHGFASLLTGTTIKHLPQIALQRMEVAVPPAAEQRRIVAKVNLLTARLTRARAELEGVDIQVAKYRQAALARYLAEVTTGAETTKFGDQISLLTSGSRDWAKYYDRGSAVFVLAGNVKPLKFDPAPKRFIDPPLDGADARRSKIERNDLLVTIVGAGTGDICRIDADYDNYFICQSVARIKLRSPELSSFYQYWFASEEHGGRDFKAAIYGAARPHLSFDQINGFVVPDVDVQKAMTAVSKIERAFTRAGRLEAEAGRAHTLLDLMKTTILAKAFKGQLVPQDPNDEPASVLLDRIRARRIASAQAKPKSRADRRITA